MKIRDADKALFDFDDDIDDLSQVSDRYPVAPVEKHKSPEKKE
jgi:hypothetical protein